MRKYLRKLLAVLAAACGVANARPSDVEVVAAVLWGEARGEGPRGIYAVAEVIRNRTRQPRRWANTPAKVATQPRQFACLNSTTPERLIGRASNSSGLDRVAWDFCLDAARQVVAGTFTDENTNGATHYHSSWPPSWAKSFALLCVIGKHFFYR